MGLLIPSQLRNSEKWKKKGDFLKEMSRSSLPTMIWIELGISIYEYING